MCNAQAMQAAAQGTLDQQRRWHTFAPSAGCYLGSSANLAVHVFKRKDTSCAYLLLLPAIAQRLHVAAEP